MERDSNQLLLNGLSNGLNEFSVLGIVLDS